MIDFKSYAAVLEKAQYEQKKIFSRAEMDAALEKQREACAERVMNTMPSWCSDEHEVNEDSLNRAILQAKVGEDNE